MSTSAETIIGLLYERRNARTPTHNAMALIRDHYNGEVTVPLTELDRNEKAAVANLITQGIDQTGMRVSSVMPSITYAPLIPGQPKSEGYAQVRRLATYSWWQQNRFVRKQRKRARWLIGYNNAPVIIRPDTRLKIPHWELRDPLNTYPAPTEIGEELLPRDVIFTFRRSYGWLCDHYPVPMRSMAVARDCGRDELFEVAEFVDADEFVQVVIARTKDTVPDEGIYTGMGNSSIPRGNPYAELEREVNRVGRCTAVVPTRTSLDRSMGQFDGMPGLYAMQARAMALWLISSERAVFPDTWFVSRPNETVTIVQEPDGRAGIPGVVKGGDLKEISVAPPPSTAQIIDLLERNQRVTAGIPSDFGGESASNVRTGKRADSLLTATVDFWVQEAQETLADAHMEENKLAIAIAKQYFDTAHSYYVNWPKATGQVDYIPSKHFENDNNLVKFPQAGSDANALVIGLGQRIGIEEMSVKTAMELDPLIENPEMELERLVIQSLEKAFIQSLDQQVAQGQLGPLELSRLNELVKVDKMPVWAAFQKLHNETQQLQAGPGAGAMDQTGQPLPQPGQPGSTGPIQGGAPGLMAPAVQASLGTGAANPPGGAVATPSPSVDHMAQLFSALRPRNIAIGNR